MRVLLAPVAGRGLSHTAKAQGVFTHTDAIAPPPFQSSLPTLSKVVAATGAGVAAGAWISKNIAGFLEENDLFVPSDDDDDD